MVTTHSTTDRLARLRQGLRDLADQAAKIRELRDQLDAISRQLAPASAAR